jgi:NADH dehydrogenase [ubiquinone] 1 alpha subcomplex assembly factor 5
MKALQKIVGTNRGISRTLRLADLRLAHLRPYASACTVSHGIDVNNKTVMTRNSNFLTSRCFSSEGGSTVAFNRKVKRLQRDSAARAHNRWDPSDRVDYDYFKQEIAHRLVDRLDDIKREEGFPLALDIGKQWKSVSRICSCVLITKLLCISKYSIYNIYNYYICVPSILGSGPGYIHRAICEADAIHGVGGIGGVRKLVQLESSKEMLHRDEHVPVEGGERCDTYRMEGNEEDELPFPDGTFDLVISSCALHWVNNLPFLFKEVNRVLKPDGCFIFAMVGGATLPELRVAMVLAEQEREGGVSPHVGPFVELSDIGSLMQRANFALPTIDVDTIHVTYPDAFVLMEHLQRMGENNASIKRRERTGRDTFLAAACLYDEMYGTQSEVSPDEKEIEASAQVLFAIGWTPDASQPQAKPRGSATHKIGEVVVDKTDGSKGS